MTSLLDMFRQDTVVDLDCNDEAVARLHKPLHDMTSNQGIVLNELSKPEHHSVIEEGAKQALEDLKAGKTTEDQLSQLAVDWMTVKLGLRVLPHLNDSGSVHAQTLPSLAYSTEGTRLHALQLVRLYNDAGVPSSRVCIKIPSTVEGLRACRMLQRDHKVQTLATAVFCVEQALAAAEFADCVYVAPYVNPLRVHIVPGAHVKYQDPLEEMPGLKVTAQIQRTFRRRNIRSKVMGASLVTADEAIALSGIDHVTLSPSLLDILANNPVDDHFKKLRTRAVTAYTPTSNNEDDIKPDDHFELTEPATALTAKLASSPVKELTDEALYHFGNAEKELLALAYNALQKLRS